MFVRLPSLPSPSPFLQTDLSYSTITPPSLWSSPPSAATTWAVGSSFTPLALLLIVIAAVPFD